MPRTKIVATIGPSSYDETTIRKMIHAGMNVARINFSHGDQRTHRSTIETLRRVAAEEDAVLAIFGDLQGPKHRLGIIKNGGMDLDSGDEITLSSYEDTGATVQLPHPDLINSIQAGGKLVIGDGEVELAVQEKETGSLRCIVTVPGILESRKGVNAPGTSLPISSITQKDEEDLAFICDLELDYVALSFVRSAEDIQQLRSLMVNRKMNVLPIIAKIEKREAIDHLIEIRDAADALMVARGDLGIEIPPQEVPILQKRIISLCNEVGLPVITATQMLQSMVEHPRPTRAEASDVANAILDGSDAIMLSAETAIGKYPVRSVEMMHQIAGITEQEFPYEMWQAKRLERLLSSQDTTEAISAASCSVAEGVNAKAIVSTTMTGHTARQIARHRPVTPILAVSPDPQTQRRLALVWGIQCLAAEEMFSNTDNMLSQAARALKPLNISSGDRIVITAGIPFGSSGHSNLIQVHEIE